MVQTTCGDCVHIIAYLEPGDKKKLPFLAKRAGFQSQILCGTIGMNHKRWMRGWPYGSQSY
jgi:hypothetical protein